MLEYLCNVIWQVMSLKLRNTALVKKILYMTVYLSFCKCKQRFPFEEPEVLVVTRIILKNVKKYRCQFGKYS